MTRQPPQSSLRRSRASGPRRRLGFSFTEVLFAVMILGVGFIMIAGIFPVSLAQTKASNEETAGAMITRGGVAMISELATQRNLPVTMGVTPIRPGMVPPSPGQIDMYRAISGNLIVAADSRRAWVPFYRRDADWTYAQVFLFPVEVRNRTEYSLREDVAASRSGFTPKGVSIAAASAADQTVTLASPAGLASAADGLDFVAEGTFLVIANDPGAAPRPPGYLTGRVYRIGSATGTANQWYLSPGADMQADPGPNGIGENGGGDDIVAIPPGLNAWMVGKGYAQGTTSFEPEGPTQDISVYTTYINLK